MAMYHYIGCGLDDIYLSNGYTEEESAYGKTVTIDDLRGLHEAIALGIVERNKNINGKEFRFLRKELDMSQSQLGELLGVSDQQIAKYEKSKPTIMAANLMRALIQEYICGSSEIAKLIDHVNKLDRKQQHIFIEQEGIWYDQCEVI